MSYFRELPNFEYIANFPNQSFNTDYVVAKNIFKRAKLREDIANAVTAFNYYQIVDNERPDQIAAKVYNNPELDWVILTTNNITNINQEWPLDNNTLYKYLIDKYGSEEELGKVHHYETVEFRDEYNRVVVPGGLQVDPEKVLTTTTVSGQNDYTLSEFPNESAGYKVTINLNQYISVYNNTSETTKAIITNIQKDFSTLKVEGRSNKIPITITNTLTTWPTSWSGVIKVKGRNEETTIQVNNFIFDNDIVLDPLLYDITSKEVDSKIVPVFEFKPQNQNNMTTPTPINGIKIKITTEVQPISVTNTQRTIISSQSIKEISNYEYEVLENEKKRKILILKPQYLSVFISDMKNIMKYDESSQYVNQTTKRGYNPKITGV